LNIKEYLADPTNDLVYSLKGVVLHSGSAQTGHYASLITIDNKWIFFNDVEVTVLPDGKFDEATAGGTVSFDDYDSGTSAYLLFYVKLDASVQVDDVVLRFDSEINLESKLDPQMVEEIRQDNSEFLKIQSIFSESLADFVMSLTDAETVMRYFFNIFCHSGLSTRTDLMSKVLRRLLKPEAAFCLKFCEDHFATVQQIFLNCTDPEILSLYSNFIRAVAGLENVNAFPFLTQLLFLLPVAFSANWKQIPKIAKCFLLPLKTHRDYVESAIAENWINSLVSFISHVYESVKSQMMLQNLDLKNIFRLLIVLLDASQDMTIKSILQFSSSILQSAFHSQDFFQLVQFLFRKQIIDMTAFLNVFSQGKGDHSDAIYQAVMAVLYATPDAQGVQSLLNNLFQRKRKFDLAFVSRMARNVDFESQTAELVLKFPKELVFRFLLDESTEIRKEAVNLVKNTFTDIRGKSPFQEIPVDISVGDLPKLTLLLAQFLDFVNGMTETDPWFPPPDADRTAFRSRLCQFIRLWKWLLLSVNQFCVLQVAAVLHLHELLVSKQTEEADPNVLSCLSLLCRFTDTLIAPHFSALYAATMEKFKSGSPFLLTGFRKFKRYLGQMNLADIQFVLNHATFHPVRRSLWMLPPACRTAAGGFFRSLAVHKRDPVVQRGILALLEFESASTVQYPAIFVTLLASVLDVLPDERIAKLLKFVLSPASSSAAVLIAGFLRVLFGNQRIRLMVKPPDIETAIDIFLELAIRAGANQVVDAFCDCFVLFAQYFGEVIQTKILSGICEAMPAGPPSYARQYLASMAAGVIVRTNAQDPQVIAESLITFYLQFDACDFFNSGFFSRLSAIVSKSDGPEWATQFVNDFPDDQIGVFGERAGSEFLKALLPKMPFADAIGIITRSSLDTEDQWRVAEHITRAFPAHRPQISAAIGGRGVVTLHTARRVLSMARDDRSDDDGEYDDGQEMMAQSTTADGNADSSMDEDDTNEREE
jgi:hypothetical protein